MFYFTSIVSKTKVGIGEAFMCGFFRPFLVFRITCGVTPPIRFQWKKKILSVWETSRYNKLYDECCEPIYFFFFLLHIYSFCRGVNMIVSSDSFIELWLKSVGIWSEKFYSDERSLVPSNLIEKLWFSTDRPIERQRWLPPSTSAISSDSNQNWSDFGRKNFPPTIGAFYHRIWLENSDVRPIDRLNIPSTLCREWLGTWIKAEELFGGQTVGIILDSRCKF